MSRPTAAERFEALARATLPELRRYLARRTDPATADEVANQTLVVCWRRLAEIPEPALPWVLGVARHTLANARRSGRRQQRLVARVRAVDPPTTQHPGPFAVDDDPGADGAAVRAALARLRPADAEVLRLWAWEELEPRGIATVLGVSANAAAVRLHRARRRLAAELAPGPISTGPTTDDRGDR